ncbi:MAG: hypothetical protein O7C98_00830 [Planctomycetota bacterium]|nr:hypothetical protein [Planctomycetota bacterium]
MRAQRILLLAGLFIASAARADDGVTEAQLGRTVRDAPLSDDAHKAIEELERRGEPGWKQLSALARALEKRNVYASIRCVEALADGQEQDRKKRLEALVRPVKHVQLRMAVLIGLARWYPDNERVLHAGLQTKLAERKQLMEALAARGLEQKVLQECLQDDLLAERAYEILLERKKKVDLHNLGSVPKIHSREGRTLAGCRRFAAAFAATPDWALLEGLMGVLDDPDFGAGALNLLQAGSGMALGRDADQWRSWLVAHRGDWKPPGPTAPGRIALAVHFGVQFLRQDLLEDGACLWPSSDYIPCTVGATALAVYTLRAAGVPAGDPAIRKALKETLLTVQPPRPPGLPRGLEDYTYAVSLLTMALVSVDAQEYRPLVDVLVAKLQGGQLQNGRWTYHCGAAGPGATGQRVQTSGEGDNSNSQYGVLGLRAARRAGVAVEQATWERAARHWRTTANRRGGWGYGPKGTSYREISMTAAGVASLALCLEGMHGPGAGNLVHTEQRIARGLVRLGQLLLEHGLEKEELYALYTLERACRLTGTRAFDDFDWYREGALRLLRVQRDSGAWGDPRARGVAVGRGYGEAVDTAYAVLFLRRATTAVAGGGRNEVVAVPDAERLKRRRERAAKSAK